MSGGSHIRGRFATWAQIVAQFASSFPSPAHADRIIGAAFTGVVNRLVKDIINPILGLIVGDMDFSDVFFTLNGQHYPTLADAQHAGAPTINLGMFINAIINFIIIGLATSGL
jgi:large conductance mechanosensitive channel protein